MTAIALDDRLAPSDQVVIRELGGESVILDLKGGTYYGLNGVGTRAWALMASGRSLRDVYLALAGEFDAAAGVIETELLRFATELCEHGLCDRAESR